MKGRVIRIPSDKETERAKAANVNAYFPAVGRYWQKDGKTYISLHHIADVVFMLQEDKPKTDEGF